MVDAYNEKAKKLGFTDTMTAIVGDLVSENSLAKLDDKNNKSLWEFDLVVVGVCMSFSP
jgi:hypothetical protein